MNSGSDIYLQSIYDPKMTISVDTGRKSKPFFLGRGPITKICDTRCSREQITFSRAKNDSKKFSSWMDEPLSFEIQPMARKCMIHRLKEDELEEVQKDKVVSLIVGDSFSIFDSYFWFSICDRNAKSVETTPKKAGKGSNNNTNTNNNTNNRSNGSKGKNLRSKNSKVDTLILSEEEESEKKEDLEEEVEEVEEVEESSEEEVVYVPKTRNQSKANAKKQTPIKKAVSPKGKRVIEKKVVVSITEDEDEEEDEDDDDYDDGRGKEEEEEVVEIHKPDPIKRVNTTLASKAQPKRQRGNSTPQNFANARSNTVKKKKRY